MFSVLMAQAQFKVERARLIGAFDASGKEDLDCMVVAGFVSNVEDWKDCDKQWMDRLT